MNLYHVEEKGWTYHGNHNVGKLFWETKAAESSFNNVSTDFTSDD